MTVERYIKKFGIKCEAYKLEGRMSNKGRIENMSQKIFHSIYGFYIKALKSSENLKETFFKTVF